MRIAPSAMLKVEIHAPETAMIKTIEDNRDLIVNLSRLEALVLRASGEKPRQSATAIVSGATIYVSLEGVIDIGKEVQRLEKEIMKVEKELEGVEKKMANEGFLTKAPEAVIQKIKEQHRELIEKRDQLKAHVEKFKAF